MLVVVSEYITSLKILYFYIIGYNVKNWLEKVSDRQLL